jgi:hypothetical protein
VAMTHVTILDIALVRLHDIKWTWCFWFWKWLLEPFRIGSPEGRSEGHIYWRKKSKCFGEERTEAVESYGGREGCISQRKYFEDRQHGAEVVELALPMREETAARVRLRRASSKPSES